MRGGSALDADPRWKGDTMVKVKVVSQRDISLPVGVEVLPTSLSSDHATTRTGSDAGAEANRSESVHGPVLIQRQRLRGNCGGRLNTDPRRKAQFFNCERYQHLKDQRVQGTLQGILLILLISIDPSFACCDDLLLEQLGAGVFVGAQSNRAVISQKGDGMRAEVDQLGTKNTLRSGQINGYGNSLTADQIGEGNNMVVQQEGHDSRVLAVQEGSSNHLYAIQIGDGNIAESEQIGDGNVLEVEQRGSLNVSQDKQLGDNNLIVKRQEGDGQVSRVTQEGDGLAITISTHN